MNIGRKFVEARRHQALQSVFCPRYRANVLVRFLFHFLSTIPRPKTEAISHFAVLHSNSTICSTFLQVRLDSLRCASPEVTQRARVQ